MELSLVAIETDADPSATEATDGPAAVESAAIEQSLDIAEPVEPVERAARAERVENDQYLAEATREYRAGQVEQPLWVRASAQAGGDEAAAVAAYLRARATVLRLAGRDDRVAAARRRPSPSQPADVDRKRPDASLRAASHGTERHRDNRAPSLRRWWPAAAALVVAAAGAAVLVALRADPVGPQAVAQVTAPAANAVTSQRPVAAPAVPVPTVIDSSAEREAKIQELTVAGNWNVLVLHAAEWTRKEPNNAKAWKHLGVGYANLKQYDDAFNAADKATQLAPADREAWKNLGRMGTAAGRPEAALQAYDQAVALDEQDAASLVEVGKLNGKLGRLPQAKSAFDRALVASPGNADALCGLGLVAQKQGRGKDAEAIAKELRRVGKDCGDTESAAASAEATVMAKSVPARGR